MPGINRLIMRCHATNPLAFQSSIPNEAISNPEHIRTITVIGKIDTYNCYLNLNACAINVWSAISAEY